MIFLLLACGTTCDVSAPLDYGGEANWLCRPGLDGACPSTQSVLVYETDGDLKEDERTYVSSTDVACFVVYPTVDNRLGAGLHLDTTARVLPEEWATSYAAPLGSVCDVYVPFYRQVIIGTYVGGDSKKKAQCFDSAYGDVEAAFEAFLEAEPTRGFAVVGHSQGAQHLSRLIRERIETDEALTERLVAGYLLGWPIGTPSETELVGGSFQKVPLCSDLDSPGCVIPYGSFLAGNDVPGRGRFDEGDVRSCVNPAAPGESGPHTMAALTVPSTSGYVTPYEGTEPRDGLLFEIQEMFSGECTGDEPALSLRNLRPEVPFKDAGLGTELGAHPIDVSVGLADMRLDLERRAAVWSAR